MLRSARIRGVVASCNGRRRSGALIARGHACGRVQVSLLLIRVAILPCQLDRDCWHSPTIDLFVSTSTDSSRPHGEEDDRGKVFANEIMSSCSQDLFFQSQIPNHLSLAMGRRRRDRRRRRERRRPSWRRSAARFPVAERRGELPCVGLTW